MEAKRKKIPSGKRCIAALCSNTNSDGVSLFTFPKDDSLATAWNREVKRTRADWVTHTKHSVICSEHFERKCFEEGPMRRAEMGIPTARPLVLKKDAIPTIFKRPSSSSSNEQQWYHPQTQPSTSSGQAQPVTVRSAYAKRERKRVSKTEE